MHFRVLARIGFFLGVVEVVATLESNPMDKVKANRAQRLARAAVNFERNRTSRLPSSVAAVISDDSLIITMRGTYSQAELASGKSPEGAARLRELDRQQFATSSAPLRQDIMRIAGVDVQEASTEEEAATGAVVQVYSLAGSVSADAWGGIDPGPTTI